MLDYKYFILYNPLSQMKLKIPPSLHLQYNENAYSGLKMYRWFYLYCGINIHGCIFKRLHYLKNQKTIESKKLYPKHLRAPIILQQE